MPGFEATLEIFKTTLKNISLLIFAEEPSRTNMEVTDIPVNILNKGQSKTTRRKIRILYEMAPAVTVMVYYIRDDGEVVADTITIPVEEVFQNEVNYGRVTPSPPWLIHFICGLKHDAEVYTPEGADA